MFIIGIVCIMQFYIHFIFRYFFFQMIHNYSYNTGRRMYEAIQIPFAYS